MVRSLLRALTGASPIAKDGAAELLRSVKSWANVDLKITPKLPMKPPEYLDHYVDTKNPIFRPLEYIASTESSLHRVTFTLCLNGAFRVKGEYINHIVEVGQALHAISLLVDDICDNTDLRRGKPAAHIVYGVPGTLHSAYTGLFNILMSIRAHLGAQCLEAAIEEAARMHHCNAVEIHTRDNYIPVTEEEYMKMVDGKTGSGFRVITRLLLTLSPLEISDEARRLLLDINAHIGRFFQIRDDYLDITSADYAKKKGHFGSDFIEGKFNYPMLHCVRTHPEHKEKFLKVLSTKVHDDEQHNRIAELTSLLETGGSLKYTLSRMEEESNTVRSMLAALREKHNVDTRNISAWFINLVLNTPQIVVDPKSPEIGFLKTLVKKTAAQSILKEPSFRKQIHESVFTD